MTARWLLCGVICVPAVWSQTTGTIQGVILDASGGSVAGASVAAKNVETGVARAAASDGNGRFVVPAVPVGVYEVRISAAGFRPFVRRGVRLTLGETAVITARLEVGAVDQEITVTGDASAVNTATSELSYLVSEEVLRELPLNGRNYTDLALLQPGVISYPHRDGGSVVAHGLATSVNGADPRSNTYLLDGTVQNDFTNGPAGSAAGTVLGMETIREFRVETNVYSAEFGRTFGGQFNALSKSGTNALHGSLYHFHRNDNVDARNFFDSTGRPEFKRNQFGGTAGGAIKTDRTFYFLGYEGLRERLGRTIVTQVPDLNARQGIIPNPANPSQTITVPVSASVRPYLDEYPLPNGQPRAGGVADYIFLFGQKTTQDFGQGRLDHVFNDRQQMFGRYTYDGGQQALPTDYPQFPRDFLSRNQFVTLGYTNVLSPRTLATLRGSFSRTRIGQQVQANTSKPLQEFIQGRGIMGDIDVGGLLRFGPQSSAGVQLTQNVYGVENHWDLLRGRHTIKAGVVMERYQDNLYNPTFGLGIFTFGSLREFLLGTPVRFIGLPPNGALDRYWRFTMMGFYVQDDFRVHPRLTLNLGLRYEFATLPVDIYGRDSAILSLNDRVPTTGKLYQNPTKKNFMPRVGFAWDPFGGGKTSVRGGFGMFYNTNNAQNLIVTITNPPATPRVIVNNPAFPQPSFAGGIGNSIRPVEWNIKNPYAALWNLNIQRELFADTVVMFGYVGSRGVHLWRSADVNIPTPQRLADGTVFFPAGQARPNTAFSTIELKKSDGNSWYQSGIIELRRRMSKGFNFQSSYTFSKNLDTTQASTFFSDSTNGTTSAMPEFEGFSYNKGLADYHAKHNWVVNLTWEMPFAKDKWFGGWQVSTIGSMRSGNPMTLFLARNRSRSQWSPSLSPTAGLDRPSMAPGYTHESAVLGGPDQYFDPRAFVLQPAGTLGNLGRGALIGPNLRAVDLSVVKNTKMPLLGESGVMQLRFEAFNLLNRANFGPPGLIAFTGAADNEQPLAGLGRIRNTVTSARQIQFGLRLRF